MFIIVLNASTGWFYYWMPAVIRATSIFCGWYFACTMRTNDGGKVQNEKHFHLIKCGGRQTTANGQELKCVQQVLVYIHLYYGVAYTYSMYRNGYTGCYYCCCFVCCRGACTTVMLFTIITINSFCLQRICYYKIKRFILNNVSHLPSDNPNPHWKPRILIARSRIQQHCKQPFNSMIFSSFEHQLPRQKPFDEDHKVVWNRLETSFTHYYHHCLAMQTQRTQNIHRFNDDGRKLYTQIMLWWWFV